MQIYSRYNFPPPVATVCVGESLTQQHFADECDINSIMSRFASSGVLVDPAHCSGVAPTFGDFADLDDYQTAQQIMIDASAAFAALPARIRDRFGNDPAGVLEFLSNEENYDEAVSLGLVDRRPVDGNDGNPLQDSRVRQSDVHPVAAPAAASTVTT